MGRERRGGQGEEGRVPQSAARALLFSWGGCIACIRQSLLHGRGGGGAGFTHRQSIEANMSQASEQYDTETLVGHKS